MAKRTWVVRDWGSHGFESRAIDRDARRADRDRVSIGVQRVATSLAES